MAGSTNFQLWNPTQANQDSDTQYTTDAQRVGGAPNGVPFPSMTGNKLFYQLSTGIWALMTMMANKGFTVMDTNPSTLASTLAAIQTTADAKLPTQILSGATGNLTLNAAQYSNFEIGMSGSCVVTFTGQQPGQIIAIVWSQPSGGNCFVSISQAVGEVFYDYNGSAASAMEFIVMGDGSLRALAPGMSGSGINGTPIGQSLPGNGRFATLVAAASTLASLAVSGTTAFGGLVVGASSIQGVVFYAAEGAEYSGYSFVGDPTTALQSPSAGVLKLVAGGVAGLTATTTSVTLALPTVFNGTANLAAGGNFSGTFSGSPAFSGSPTSTTPVSTDNSQRVATTNWVQALFAAMGAAFSIATDGYIKFPSFLGSLIIQWGVSGTVGGGTSSFNFPITFPNACFMLTATPYNTTNNANYITVYSYSTTGCTFNVDGSGAACMFIAIGH